MLGSAESTSRLRNRLVSFGLSITALAIVSALAAPAFDKALGELRAQAATDSSLWPISMDYPEDGSIFPPGITPPTFLWRDALASSWTIDVTLPGGTASDPRHLEGRADAAWRHRSRLRERNQRAAETQSTTSCVVDMDSR